MSDRTLQDDRDGGFCRRLIRAAGTAALATADHTDGWPYVSLVQAACAIDGTPILLLSDLAEHTRNIGLDPRVSLLYDVTGETAEKAGLVEEPESARAELVRLFDRHARRKGGLPLPMERNP